MDYTSYNYTRRAGSGHGQGSAILSNFSDNRKANKTRPATRTVPSAVNKPAVNIFAYYRAHKKKKTGNANTSARNQRTGNANKNAILQHFRNLRKKKTSNASNQRTGNAKNNNAKPRANATSR